MTHKKHNQSRQENPTHVQDEGLSLEMAYAEKSHIEDAQKAMKQGKFAEVSGHLAIAEASSSQSAEDFISQQQAKLDELRKQVGSSNHEAKSSFEQTVEAIKQNWFERYEQYGAKKEDFNLVEVENLDDITEQVLTYTALQGIDLGDPSQIYDEKRSYNSVMADNQTHISEVNGQQYDDRGLTEPIYRSFISQQKTEGVNPLPDSPRLLEPRTLSLLTGEPADDDDARFAVVVVGGRPFVYWVTRGDDRQNVRFRPAVKISQS